MRASLCLGWSARACVTACAQVLAYAYASERGCCITQITAVCGNHWSVRGQWTSGRWARMLREEPARVAACMLWCCVRAGGGNVRVFAFV